MMKKRIFCDMDGTLAVFNLNASLEDLFTAGYFRRLSSMPQMVAAARELASYPNFEFYVLSHYLNEQALEDKNRWLDEHLTISASNRIFVPYGESKCSYIPNGYRTDDVLLDDFSPNLHRWNDHGVGIKVLNGINWNHKTWCGHVINGLADAGIIVAAVSGIAYVSKQLVNSSAPK